MILVTGGTGTTGSFVIRELLDRGFSVRALVRPTSVRKLAGLNVEIVLGDLADADSLKKATEGVSGIVHAACTFTDSQVDQAGLRALLNGWKNGSFVLISSVDVYGVPQYLPLDENHPLNSTGTNYGINKVRCEAILKNQVSQNARTGWSIIRPPQIWAPHPSCAEKIVRHYKPIWSGKTIGLATNEKNTLTPGDAWIDARELAWIAAECLEKPVNKAINVFNSHFTWRELYQELIELTSSESLIEPKPSSEVYGIYAHTWQYKRDSLVEHLGFQATYDWRETLAEVVAIAQHSHHLSRDLGNPARVASSQRKLLEAKSNRKISWINRLWDQQTSEQFGT